MTNEEVSAQLAEDLVVYGMWVVHMHADGTWTRIDPTEFYVDNVEEVT